MSPIALGDALLLREMFESGEKTYQSRFSQSGKKLILELENNGVVKRGRVGTRSWVVRPLSKEGFYAYIKIYLSIDNLEAYILALQSQISGRDQLASMGVSTKLKKVGPKTGMHINSPYPLKITIDGKKIDISFPTGSALFVHEGCALDIPEDIVVVGVENFTNVTHAGKQRHLFIGYGNVLFAERSKMLQGLLGKLSNRYVHFGDIDLAGVNIYQTEYLPIVGERGSFFLPCAVDELFAKYKGVADLYEIQANRFKTLEGSNDAMKEILTAIHSAKSGIEQEVFIASAN